jgi:AcrR family transcriptional regulator
VRRPMASRAAAPAKRSTTVAARASAPRKSRGKRPAPAPLRESEGRLGLRRPPSQGRGLVTFERVLATATELLDRVGAEGLTTNLIASESGVNISSIYKYFPNKHAILVALFERYNQQRFEAVRELVETFGGSPDWEHTLDKTIDKILSTRRATPGNVALRRAMRSSPELAEIDQQANQSVARWFSEQVRQLTGLPERRAHGRVAAGHRGGNRADGLVGITGRRLRADGRAGDQGHDARLHRPVRAALGAGEGMTA